MPEYLSALIYILLISTVFFAFAGRTAVAIIGRDQYRRRRNLWFGLTLSAFLASNFWIYTFIAIFLLLYTKRHESNLISLFFFVLFTLPAASIPIPGGGLVNYIFELSHARILVLVIMLPAFLLLIRKNNTLPFGHSGSDKIFTAYLLLSAILYLRESTFTDALRQTLYLFMDIFLPYFVISRSLNNLQSFKDALLSLVIAIMILAMIAIAESLRDWLLYRPLLDKLDLQAGMTGYLGRDGMLRVSASVGHPIALGYLMTIGIGFYLFLQQSIQHNFVRRLGMALLVVGLLAPLSRGPWVGSCVLLFIFLATGRYPVRRMMGMASAGILALLLVSAFPGGERAINLLPFVGTTEKENVDYREQLFNNSIIVIERNLWFGSVNFNNNPEMEELRAGGGGIIDVVNSYIRIALEKGIVGLGLFVSFFALVLTGVRRAMRSIADQKSEEYLLGRVLLATLLAILVIIFTVSSISIIPLLYWSVAGLCVAYERMLRNLPDNNMTTKYANYQ